jgi:ABC-2 type transport system ATP-binding protein
VVTRGQILEVVRERARAGCAVVYTSHYLGEIEELGATVAVLEDGTIIARSSLEELIARHGSPALRLTFDGPAPSLPGFTVEGSVATLRTPDPAHDAAIALGRLNGSAERLSGIEILRPSLEAAYLALTGRRSNEVPPSGLSTTPSAVSHEDSDELVA